MTVNTHYDVAAHPMHLRTGCPQAAKIFHGIYCSHIDTASNLNSHLVGSSSIDDRDILRARRCRESKHGAATSVRSFSME